ncbi:hypothetical protein Aperf_G00000073726 [Anoplocephala perfoliata]
MDYEGTCANVTTSLDSSHLLPTNVNIPMQSFNRHDSQSLHLPPVCHQTTNISSPSFVPQPPLLQANFLPAASTSISLPPTQPFPSVSGPFVPQQGVSNSSINSPPEAASNAENTRAITNSSAIAAEYKKYYTAVLTYFKNAIDAMESSNSSNPPPQAAVPISVPILNLQDDPWSRADAVMKGYFSKNGSRVFTWASFHNYISWISRKHPVWYRIFCECSKKSGIDWNIMYQKWMNFKTDEQQTPVFDLSKPPPTTTSDPQQAPPPPITNPFPLTSVPPPKDSRVWCEDCDLYFPTQRAYDIHLRGVVHIQNALTKTITQNASAVLDIPPPQWPPTNQLLSTESVTLPRNRPIIDTSRPTRKIDLRLQHLLDICIQPLVGLNYVIEFQRRNLLECIYICDLCDKCAFLPSGVIQHVCSRKHRMAYLKYHYPPLFHLMKLDKSCHSVRKRRLASYAQQIESTEGRKRLSIMLEKENSSFKTRVESTKPKPKKVKRPPTPLTDQKIEKPSEVSHSSDVVSPNMISNTSDSAHGLEDDEIEEGEMLDCSSSSSYVDAPDDGKHNEGESSSKYEDVTGIGSRSGRGVIFSPSSQSSEDEGYDHELPTFFTAGIETQSEDSAPSILVHLPDFEVGFVSERPQLPDLSPDSSNFVSDSSEFIDRITKERLLNVHYEEPGNHDPEADAIASPSDSRLTESFEEEVQWTLKLQKKVPRKSNPLKFSCTPQLKPSSAPPLLPNPPSVTETGAGFSNLKNNGESVSDIVKRAVRVLLGDFKPPSPTKPLLSSPKSPGAQASTANMSRPLLLQPPLLPTLPYKSDEHENPPKRPKVDKLDGVKSLLSTPLDALNALLSESPSTSSQDYLEQQQQQPSIIYTTTAFSSTGTTSTNTTLMTPAPTEIFDGYSYFSRQEEEEERARKRREEHQQKKQAVDANTDKVKKPPLLTHRPRSSTAATSSNPARMSRLAAFADMYGMNEPSIPQPQRAAPQQQTISTHVIPPPTVLQTAGRFPGNSATQASQSLWLTGVPGPSLWRPPTPLMTPAVPAYGLNPTAFTTLPPNFIMPSSIFGGPILPPPQWQP